MTRGRRVKRDRGPRSGPPAPPTIVLALAAILLVPMSASAGIERAGTTAANFLTIGSGVGMLGMGGAGLGIEGGLATAGWNVASIASVGRSEIVFSHAALADQTAQEWGGVAGRLPFAGLRGAVTGLFQSEGTFEGRDAFNNPTGNFEVSSMALGLALARTFGRTVTAGLGLKYTSENLGSVRGSGVTFDAGLQARAGAFGFGAAAQNAFGQMRYDGAIYDFPSSYGVGVSYDHVATGLRVAFDMNFPPAYYTDVRGGIEWRWNDRFALRTGYRAEMGAGAEEPLGGPTFGMGAGARGMWLDYGYLAGGAGQHRIGITFQPEAMAMLAGEPDHGRSAGYSPAGASVPGAHTTSEGKRASATPGAPPMPGPPATAGASVAPVAGKDAAAAAPTTAGAKPASSNTSAKPGSASAPSQANAPEKLVAGKGAAAAAPTTVSAPEKLVAGKGAAAAAPTNTSAKPSPAGAPAPTSAVAGSGSRVAAGAAAGQAAGAAGPVASQLSTARTAPPSYTQRAKAARGTSEASAASRSTAAANAGAAAPPRAPVAPAAEAATAKKDSTTASKASAVAPAAPASPPQAPAASSAGAVAGPGAGAPQAPATPPVPAKPRPEKVKVKGKQTMADIAATYGTSVAAIMMENNLTSDRVRSGQVLKLPKR